MSISDIAEFNAGRSVHNREWTVETIDEITINIVDTSSTEVETKTVKYFKKKGMGSGMVFRPTGGNVLITSITGPSGLEGDTQELLNGNPISIAADTLFKWTKRCPEFKQLKILCSDTSTLARILVL